MLRGRKEVGDNPVKIFRVLTETVMTRLIKNMQLGPGYLRGNQTKQFIP